MSPKDALKLSINMSDLIINTYIGDLSDADIFIRPVPGMNHIAWQLGHLISAEHHFVDMVQAGLVPGVAGRFRRGPHQGNSQARRPGEVFPVLKVPGALEGTAGGNAVRARQCSRVRPGQDRSREVPRMGSDRGRAAGDERNSRADALRPVRRRPASSRQAGADLNPSPNDQDAARTGKRPCRAVLFKFKVPSPSARPFASGSGSCPPGKPGTWRERSGR